MNLALPQKNSAAMSQEQFETVTNIALSEAGLFFSASKMALVSSRLAKRVRSLKFRGYDEYCAFISSKEGEAEVRFMISALTTNVSSFFRENHHFETLKNEVIRETIESHNTKIRIWSAGCSVGMEAYSIAISILEKSARHTRY